MSFNAFMDAWFERPVAGLPLRMIFLCGWHRVHACLIGTGAALFGLGTWQGIGWLRSAGLALIAPSLNCFVLLIALVPLFLVLERLLPGERDGT